MKTAVVTQSEQGKDLAEKIAGKLPDCLVEHTADSVGLTIKRCWSAFDCIICIMSTDVIIRSIASLCSEKSKEPTVIAIDERGDFVIGLLAGHTSEGLKIVERIAGITGGQPVILTNQTPLDIIEIDRWAKRNNLTITDPKKLETILSKRQDTGFITLYSDMVINSMPKYCKEVHSSRGSDVIISHKYYPANSALRLCPKNLVAGISFDDTANAKVLDDAIAEVFEKMGFDRYSLCALSSIDLNQDSEFLQEFAKKVNCPVCYFSKDELNNVSGVSTSVAVLSATGAKGVAEPAAILGATTSMGSGKLIVRKQRWKSVTVAVAEKRIQFKELS